MSPWDESQIPWTVDFYLWCNGTDLSVVDFMGKTWALISSINEVKPIWGIWIWIGIGVCVPIKSNGNELWMGLCYADLNALSSIHQYGFWKWSIGKLTLGKKDILFYWQYDTLVGFVTLLFYWRFSFPFSTGKCFRVTTAIGNMYFFPLIFPLFFGRFSLSPFIIIRLFNAIFIFFFA